MNGITRREIFHDLPDFLTREATGEIRLSGHRIGLFHVVHYYNEGYSAEMLVCQFPTLPLALIHKVIGFYLENKADTHHALATAWCARAAIDFADLIRDGRTPKTLLRTPAGRCRINTVPSLTWVASGAFHEHRYADGPFAGHAN